MTDQLAITYLERDKLTPNERNSRVHSPEQVQQIANSIEEFGFVSPILVDDDNVVIAGHGRLMAAELIGMDSVPVVSLRHLSEAQKRALIIADNKLTENAAWDNELLKFEANELAEMGIDVSIMGFSDVELKAFFGDVVDDPQAEWGKGTPEYVSNSLKPTRTLLVHFMTEDDCEKFQKLVGQQLTEKTRFMWFPAQERVPQGEVVSDGSEDQ